MTQIKYLFVTHGSFGKGIESSLKVIMGDMLDERSIEYLEITSTTSNENIVKKIKNFFIKNRDLTIVTLTDIPIGSSTQDCIKAIGELEDDVNIHLVSGINLPFCLSLLMTDEDIDISTKIKKLVNENREMLIYLNTKVDEEND